jgi:putative peptidoglycan lipid II flippase
VQSILGAVAVAVAFVAVAYPLDRHDMRPLATMLARRIRRRRGEETA